MANVGNKKTRHIKNLGSVYYDNNRAKWIGQITIGKYNNGRVKVKRFVSSNQNDVIDKMRKYNKIHANNMILDEIKNSSGDILVSEYFHNYMLTVKKIRLKRASYTRELGTLNNHVIPYIGEYRMNELTTEIIQNEVLNKLIYRGYSFSTIHKAYVLINQCLKYAYHQHIISSNPCDFVAEPSKKIFTRKPIRFFTDEEIAKFIDCATLKDSNNQYKYTNGIALVILMYTGLRAGELMALQWQDVNLKSNYLNIHKNVVTYYDDNNERKVANQEDTKTQTHRFVYLTKSAKSYLKHLYLTRKPRSNDYLVITTSKRSIDSLETTYHSICKRANILNPQGLHTLRHTYASLLIRKKVDIKIISETLGHASVAFTYNTYVHLIEEEKAKTIKEIDI